MMPAAVRAWCSQPTNSCSASVWCATSSQLAGLGGVYCENCDIALVKTEGDDGVRPYAIDPEIAQRMWTWSERWIS